MRKTRMAALLLVLSLLVSLNVFWSMRQTGLTLAGNADCGMVEHSHDAECQGGPTPCTLEEHTHSVYCYSDEEADLETPLDWQAMFADYPYSGDLRTDLVGIAKTQVGYTESKLNFQVGEDSARRGYTRYGAWYGAPYNDWSAMFVSFCLHYAGANSEEYPPNSGGAAMAELWKAQGKYAAAGQYTPAAGDLVFFKDHSVGIVSEVQKNSFIAIQGNQADAVCSSVLSLKDANIEGWGLTARPITKDHLLDISNGPAVYIIEGGTAPQQAARYAARRGRSVDLPPYLEANGGSYFFTLLDKNNQELPKDADGNYVVISDTGYKLTISFTSPEGFQPSTYYYQLPDGLLVDGGEGNFILKDGTNVGSWTVSDQGLITLVFNEHINSRTDITISATLGIHFPEQKEPIDFDGKISVTVQKPPAESQATSITKWGIQGSEETPTKPDPTKIYWNVCITGRGDSEIVGSVLSDKIVTGEWIGDQHYTQSDMAQGLRFGVSDPTNPYNNWHNWTVYPGDPNLTWTEDGWSYKIPETITCWCGEVTLGNEGWVYYVDYSSTPDITAKAGTLYYMNRVTVDNQYTDGGASFTQGEILGEVFKNGSFVTDAASGAFLWEVQAVIPARKEGQKAEYHWYLMDYMYLLDQDGYNAGPMKNDANLATVTVNYNGTVMNVPNIKDATDQDLFAWDNAWTAVNNGVDFGQEINLLCRCQCNEESCPFWNGDCQEYWYEREDGVWDTNGFCQCWTPTENVIFTITYKTTDLSAVEAYGGLGYRLLNVAELYYKPNGGSEGSLVSSGQASVSIPGIFEKELTHDFDGQTAHYQITVNEAKLVLTNGSPLKIHDVMTNTLAYISGSMVINAIDANGNVTVLHQGEDYTIDYDGTGNVTDATGKEVHILDIVILRPQPVTYVLDYDATLIFPEQVTGGIKYTNSASISLWGQDVYDTSAEKVYADINIAAKSYKTELYKTSAQTGEPLSGATFGLYNAQGGLITTEVTDANGRLVFQTDIVEGIVLREHELYYAQELRAPPGYQLDDTKHWFCFCNEPGGSCEVYDHLLVQTNAIRIPFEQIGKIEVTNQVMNYDLPATGGPGVYPLILVSVVLILTPLVYRFIRRRKQERRGDG